MTSTERIMEATDNCPCCGSPVAVNTADEGTSSFVAITRQQLAAHHALYEAVDHFIENYDDFHHHPEFRPVVALRDTIKEALRDE